MANGKSIREMYDSFTSSAKLTKTTFRDLVHLCGYSPTEQQLDVPIPSTFDEFHEILKSFTKTYTRDDFYGELYALAGCGHISKEELVKVLKCGDKLSDEELSMFFKIVPSENGQVSLNEMIDILYADE
jgi:Ca2+-binding EF-hand superfamily protein